MSAQNKNISAISCLAHGDKGIHVKYQNSQVLNQFLLIILDENDTVDSFVGRTRPYPEINKFQSFFKYYGRKGPGSSLWKPIEWKVIDGRLIGSPPSTLDTIYIDEFIVSGDFDSISIAIIGIPTKSPINTIEANPTSPYRGLFAADILSLNTKNPILEYIDSVKFNFLSFCKDFPPNRSADLNFLECILDILLSNNLEHPKYDIDKFIESLKSTENPPDYQALTIFLLDLRKNYICSECIQFKQSQKKSFRRYNNCYSKNKLCNVSLDVWYRLIDALNPESYTDLEIYALLSIHRPLAESIHKRLIDSFQDGNNARSLRLVHWLNPIANTLSLQGFKFKWKFISDFALNCISNFEILESFKGYNDVLKFSYFKNLKFFVLNPLFRVKLVSALSKTIEEMCNLSDECILNRALWHNLAIICSLSHYLKLTELESAFSKLANSISKFVDLGTNRRINTTYPIRDNIGSTYNLIIYTTKLINKTLNHLIQWQKILQVAAFSLTDSSDLTIHLYYSSRYLRYDVFKLTGLLLPVPQIVTSKNAFKHGPTKIVDYFSNSQKKLYITELDSFLWSFHKYEIAEEIVEITESKTVDSFFSKIELDILKSPHKLSIEAERNYNLFQAYHLLISNPGNYEDIVQSDVLSRFIIDGCFSNNPTSLVISGRIAYYLGIDGDNKFGLTWIEDLDQAIYDRDYEVVIRLLMFGQYSMNPRLAKSPQALSLMKGLFNDLVKEYNSCVGITALRLITALFQSMEDSIGNGALIRPLVESLCDLANSPSVDTDMQFHIDLVKALTALRLKKRLMCSMLFQIPDSFLAQLLEGEDGDSTIPVSSWSGFCLKELFSKAVSENIAELSALLLDLCLLLREAVFNTSHNLYSHFINILIYGVDEYLNFDSDTQSSTVLRKLVDVVKNAEEDSGISGKLVQLDMERVRELLLDDSGGTIPLRIPVEVFSGDATATVLDKSLELFVPSDITEDIDNIWEDIIAIHKSKEWNMLKKIFKIELDGEILKYYESESTTAEEKSRKRSKKPNLFRQRRGISSRAPSKHVDDYEFASELASSLGKPFKMLKMEMGEWKKFVSDCKTMKIKIDKIIQDPKMLKNEDIRATLSTLLEKHTGVGKALELIGVNIAP